MAASSRPPSADFAAAAPHPGYRPCVGLMLVKRPQQIFLGERHGPQRNAWQMPQGGIDPGETPREAAWRELREEVGTDRAALAAESRRWYAYDLPADLAMRAWRAPFRGQTQRWFGFTLLGADQEIDITGEDSEFRRWRWASPQEVLRLAWPPKRPVYEAVLEEFSHLLA